MLKIKFRNVYITEENHSDLLREEIEKALENFSQILYQPEQALRNNPPEDTCCSFVRLKVPYKLAIVYIKNGRNNPYLLLWNNNKKEFHNMIPFSLIKPLSQSPLDEVLKDASRDIDFEKFSRLYGPELSDKIENYLFNRM